APAAGPRLAEPVAAPEDVARLRPLGAEPQHAEPAVDDHGPAPGVPLEGAGVLEGALVDQEILGRHQSPYVAGQAAPGARGRAEPGRRRTRGKRADHGRDDREDDESPRAPRPAREDSQEAGHERARREHDGVGAEERPELGERRDRRRQPGRGALQRGDVGRTDHRGEEPRAVARPRQHGAEGDQREEAGVRQREPATAMALPAARREERQRERGPQAVVWQAYRRQRGEPEHADDPDRQRYPGDLVGVAPRPPPYERP